MNFTADCPNSKTFVLYWRDFRPHWFPITTAGLRQIDPMGGPFVAGDRRLPDYVAPTVPNPYDFQNREGTRSGYDQRCLERFVAYLGHRSNRRGEEIFDREIIPRLEDLLLQQPEPLYQDAWILRDIGCQAIAEAVGGPDDFRVPFNRKCDVITQVISDQLKKVSNGNTTSFALYRKFWNRWIRLTRSSPFPVVVCPIDPDNAFDFVATSTRPILSHAGTGEIWKLRWRRCGSPLLNPKAFAGLGLVPVIRSTRIASAKYLLAFASDGPGYFGFEHEFVISQFGFETARNLNIDGSADQAAPKAPKLFISYASEQKGFVDRLASKLELLGIHATYLSGEGLGKSVRDRIDKAILESCCALAIVSPDSLQKGWTKAEQDVLIARDSEGLAPLFVVCHEITPSELAQYSPTLSGGRIVASSTEDIDILAKRIDRAVRKRMSETLN